ncbi:MAG: HD domain-containing protein [Gammaproteobacteria bacterium]|nr:MAG: HD domain-containing protein [Gammaproteobacteria bacterium]UCH41399.1 MAG: HD domain-containing protein [Gammaproteobacteria bacterium]
MTVHNDALEQLNQLIPLQDKLCATHKSVADLFPFIERIAIAIYDPETSVLKTYLHSSGEDNPLDHYSAPIDDAPSLKEILKTGLPRVINNMLTFEGSESEHTKRLGRCGYAASYTMPMFNNGVFFGFIFFNSKETDVFDEKTLRQLDTYGHLISLMVINEIASIRVLNAALKTTGHITHLRDPETGSHLDRMSRYSRLIAASIAGQYELDDGYIEHIFMFSPLHDIGKIGIPDEILLKPDQLDEAEAEVMHGHASLGKSMVDQILSNFGLENIEHVDMLRNIAEFHHESVNGRGYPNALAGQQIPLEARIVAVADVFDALTSARPYKSAWSNEDAIAELKKLAGEKLDKDCVDALIRNLDEVEQIQKQFSEDFYG